MKYFVTFISINSGVAIYSKSACQSFWLILFLGSESSAVLGWGLIDLQIYYSFNNKQLSSFKMVGAGADLKLLV